MWKLKGRKLVYDFDGFTTDYSWWQDTDTKNNVMIFGDSDLYDPENSEPDYETEDEKQAEEWFDTYDIDSQDLDEHFIDDVVHRGENLYNGASYRGARVPSAIAGRINEIDIPDNMRLKNYDFSQVAPGEYEFEYTTQEPFSAEDADAFFKEFSEMLKHRNTKGIKAIAVTVIARDGKEYGYALRDYRFDENGNLELEESAPNIVLEASGEPKVINLRRYGFVPAPSEDFSDDGNRFKVYYYDPKHTGDRRIRLTKLTADGEAYISAEYRNPDTGKYTFFDDLNGVSYTAAVQGLDALVKKIADFVAKLDAGEMKAKDLTDDQIKEIKEKVSQMIALGDLKWDDALNKVTQKMGIDLKDVRTAQRDQLKKEIESAVRNSRKEDPIIVKALAKEFLKVALKNLEGTPSSYVGKSWKEGKPAMSLEDAIKATTRSYLRIYTSPYDKSGKELIDKGYPEGVSFYFKDLKDSTQDRIEAWAKDKIEKLYDFEYEEDKPSDNLEEVFDVTMNPNEGKEGLVEEWYDDLDDSDAHAKSYKEDALKVDKAFAEKIIAALEDYIKTSKIGFISYADLKKYAEMLGIAEMKPGPELSQVWHDVYNVASYYAFGQKDFDRSQKLLDAQSAFSEVVNQVARDYRKNHADEGKEDALAAINDIITDPAFTTTDSEGDEYLSREAISKIKQIAKSAGLTQEELKKISSNFFGAFGYKIVESLNENYDFYSGDELISGFVNNMSDDDIDNNLRLLNQYAGAVGLGRRPEKLVIYTDSDHDITEPSDKIKTIKRATVHELDGIKFVFEPKGNINYLFFKNELEAKKALDKLLRTED